MHKMKLEVYHVNLEVKGFSKAMRFYKALFKAAGFKRLQGGEGWAEYANGKITLYIGESDKPLIPGSGAAEEKTVMEHTDHITFSLGAKSEVDKLCGALIKAGFTPILPARACPDSGPGLYAATFFDPSRNVLKIGNRK